MTTTSRDRSHSRLSFPSLQSAPCIANHREPVTQATDSEIAQSWVFLVGILIKFALRYDEADRQRENVLVHDEDEGTSQKSRPSR